MRKLRHLIPACFVCTAAGLTADDADLFKQLDTNGDSVVEREEVGEERVRFFERLVRVGDKNEDGKLSLDEFNAALSEPPASSPEGERFGGRRGFGPPEGREMPGPQEILNRLDTNKDGKLQRDELVGPGEMLGRLMDRLDTDELTLEQLESARDRMRSMMAERGDRPEMADRGRGPEGRPPYGPPRGEAGERGPRPEGGPNPERGGPERDGQERDGQERDGRPPMDRDIVGRDGAGREGDFRRPPMPGGEGGPGNVFRVLDENHDGHISKLEAVRLIELFGEIDRNGDGHLDPSELFGRPGGEMGPPEFARIRGDRPDGPPEMRRGEGGERGPRGPEGDRGPRPEGPRPGQGPDGDRGPEMRDGDRPGFGRGPGPGGPFGGDRPGRGNPEEFFSRLDKNGDGEIGKDELPPFLADRFERMDRNSDGKLTKDEFRRPEGDAGPRPDGPPRGDRPAGPPRGERPERDRPEGETRPGRPDVE